jgi:hypothetical protein
MWCLRPSPHRNGCCRPACRALRDELSRQPQPRWRWQRPCGGSRASLAEYARATARSPGQDTYRRTDDAVALRREPERVTPTSRRSPQMSLTSRRVVPASALTLAVLALGAPVAGAQTAPAGGDLVHRDRRGRHAQEGARQGQLPPHAQAPRVEGLVVQRPPGADGLAAVAEALRRRLEGQRLRPGSAQRGVSNAPCSQTISRPSRSIAMPFARLRRRALSSPRRWRGRAGGSRSARRREGW